MLEEVISEQTVLGERISFFRTPLGKGKKRLLLIGGFHGDEPEGVFLLERFVTCFKEKLSDSPDCIGIVPCLNPDGLKQKTRENAHKVDLNRNYPTHNFADKSFNPHTGVALSGSPGSEIETRFMMRVIESFCPDRILSLHSDLKVVDYDGPAEDWAREIAALSGYRFVQNVGYETPGSFGTWAGVERKIPVVTLETESAPDLAKQEVLWQRLKPVFLSFLKG